MDNSSIFSCISLSDLVTARDNCEFLMTHSNISLDLYEKLYSFHSDLILEIDRRLKHG